MVHSRTRSLPVMSMPLHTPVQPHTSVYLIPSIWVSKKYNLLSMGRKFGQGTAGSTEGRDQAAVPVPFLIWPRS